MGLQASIYAFFNLRNVILFRSKSMHVDASTRLRISVLGVSGPAGSNDGQLVTVHSPLDHNPTSTQMIPYAPAVVHVTIFSAMGSLVCRKGKRIFIHALWWMLYCMGRR